jgi:hypothetical protein
MDAVAPMAGVAPWLALKAWDRERGFVPASGRAPVADLTTPPGPTT